MKWHKTYFDQIQECRKTDNRFIIETINFDAILNPWVVVCVPFKSFCSSKNCFEKRKKVLNGN